MTGAGACPGRGSRVPFRALLASIRPARPGAPVGESDPTLKGALHNCRRADQPRILSRSGVVGVDRRTARAAASRPVAASVTGLRPAHRSGHVPGRSGWAFTNEPVVAAA